MTFSENRYPLSPGPQVSRIPLAMTQAASQGLSQNEIGSARLSMMARSTYAPSKGRIQMRKTTPSICSRSACTARPVHTVVPQAPYDFDHAGLGIAKSTDKKQIAVGTPSPRSSSGRAHANGLHDGQRSSSICSSPILAAPRLRDKAQRILAHLNPTNKDIRHDFHHAFPLVR